MPWKIIVNEISTLVYKTSLNWLPHYHQVIYGNKSQLKLDTESFDDILYH